jgi:hypothetical protein
MQTSKIQHIGEISSFNTDNGLLYSVPLRLEDGSEGLTFKKSADALSVGQEITYTIEEKTSRQGKTYNKITEVKEDTRRGSSGGGKSYSDPKTMILAFSKDVIVAAMSNGLIEPDADYFQATIDGADRFMQWYEGHSGKQNVEFTADSMSVARDVPQQRQESVERAFTGDPVAKNLGDMITSKQIGLVRAKAREHNIDAEALCSEMFGCDVEDLSKESASSFIDRLLEVAKSGGR